MSFSHDYAYVRCHGGLLELEYVARIRDIALLARNSKAK